MAMSNILFASILISALVLLAVQADPPMASPAPSGPIDCDAACTFRCSKSSRPNLCERACGSCCKRCKCVPPGTNGNYDSCLCYANITTRGGKPKCP